MYSFNSLLTPHDTLTARRFQFCKPKTVYLWGRIRTSTFEVGWSDRTNSRLGDNSSAHEFKTVRGEKGGLGNPSRCMTFSRTGGDNHEWEHGWINSFNHQSQQPAAHASHVIRSSSKSLALERFPHTAEPRKKVVWTFGSCEISTDNIQSSWKTLVFLENVIHNFNLTDL